MDLSSNRPPVHKFVLVPKEAVSRHAINSELIRNEDKMSKYLRRDDVDDRLKQKAQEQDEYKKQYLLSKKRDRQTTIMEPRVFSKTMNIPIDIPVNNRHIARLLIDKLSNMDHVSGIENGTLKYKNSKTYDLAPLLSFALRAKRAKGQGNALPDGTDTFLQLIFDNEELRRQATSGLLHNKVLREKFEKEYLKDEQEPPNPLQSRSQDGDGQPSLVEPAIKDEANISNIPETQKKSKVTSKKIRNIGWRYVEAPKK